MVVLFIALGAAFGAPLRYVIDRAVQSRHRSVFPWGTVAVNVAGSLIFGFVAALPAGPVVTAAVGAGFCGALTTYSTFGYATVRLAYDRAYLLAGMNIAISVLACLGAVYCGMSLASAVSSGFG